MEMNENLIYDYNRDAKTVNNDTQMYVKNDNKETVKKDNH
jgi:hypothetical protein